MIERRFTKGAEVRARSGDKPGIEGYGAVFNQEYVMYDDGELRIVEIIKPGAFDPVVEEKQDVRCLFNHSADNLLGRTTNKTLRLKQDDSGLFYENDFDLRTTVAQNVQAFIDRRDITGCSFAFVVGEQTWREEQKGKTTTCIREITKMKVVNDVGPVTYPAYEGTSVAARSEMRSQILAIDGLPPEVRQAIERGKKKEINSADCGCRCVACVDNKCENCADNMVDCGDEENCRCMDKRSAAPEADLNLDRSRIDAEIDARLRNSGLKPAAIA